MKKLLIGIILTFILCSTGAVAEEMTGTAIMPEIPQTYKKTDFATFSLTNPYDELEYRFLTCWDEMGAFIDVSDMGMSVDDITYMYWEVYYKNPEYYYIDSFSYNYNKSTNQMLSIEPNYKESSLATAKANMQKIVDAKDEILLYVNDNMTDFEKVMTVHDYMVLNYSYDTSYSNYTTTIMYTKSGVCMSYALSFNYVMSEIGIPTSFVTSDSMNHAWSLVMIDGEWYHIDPTYNDPLNDRYAMVGHEYALLSSNAIENNVSEPHVEFDTRGYTANSTKYDNAAWHATSGAIQYVGGKSYWAVDNSIVCEDGTQIFTNLDGGDGYWNINSTQGFQNRYRAGLAELNGILYFNTDKAIYKYNPATRKSTKILDATGPCGLYIDKTTLYYNKYDISTSSFVKAGSINLGNVRIGETYLKDGNLITKVYTKTNDRLNIVSSSASPYEVRTISNAGLHTITHTPALNQTIMYITDELTPIKSKVVF